MQIAQQFLVRPEVLFLVLLLDLLVPVHHPAQGPQVGKRQPEDVPEAAEDVHAEEHDGREQDVEVELLRVSGALVPEPVHQTVDELVVLHRGHAEVAEEDQQEHGQDQFDGRPDEVAEEVVGVLCEALRNLDGSLGVFRVPLELHRRGSGELGPVHLVCLARVIVFEGLLDQQVVEYVQLDAGLEDSDEDPFDEDDDNRNDEQDVGEVHRELVQAVHGAILLDPPCIEFGIHGRVVDLESDLVAVLDELLAIAVGRLAEGAVQRRATDDSRRQDHKAQHDQAVNEEVLDGVPPGSEGLFGRAVAQDFADQSVADGSHVQLSGVGRRLIEELIN